MKLLISFLLLIWVINLSADPFKITAIFLSGVSGSSSSIENNKLKLYGALSVREEECVKMGEHCFHPQYGIIKEGKEKEVKGIASPDIEMSHMNLDDVDQLKCSKGEFFDFYCGKMRKEKNQQAELEVWIDTSSSMRRVDYSKDGRYCERRNAVSLLKRKCGTNLELHGFDTGKRQVLDDDLFCRNVGMNDGRRLVKWMKSSDAKHLMIVTDVDEYNGEFRDYLDNVSAKVIGIGTKVTTATELSKIVSRYSTSCK